MDTLTLTGFIARETEAAVAFVQQGQKTDVAPLWLPRRKIVALHELDALSARVQLKGEGVARQAIPVTIEIDAAFAAKVGAA
jgi:hypothetical protein